MAKYRVSHYQEYPIYEPAEGGYYYAGAHVTGFREYDSLKEARAELKRVRKWMADEGRQICDGNDAVIIPSKHIGGDEYFLIEGTKKNPINGRVSGKQVYC